MSRHTRGIRIAILVAIGLLVVFVAGGVSMSRWAPKRTPGPAPSAPAETAMPGASGGP